MGTDVVGSGLPWVDAIAGSFAPYSFGDFHRVELPRLAAEHAALVVDDLRGVVPVAFRIDDSTTFTWQTAAAGSALRSVVSEVVGVLQAGSDRSVVISVRGQVPRGRYHDRS